MSPRRGKDDDDDVSDDERAAFKAAMTGVRRLRDDRSARVTPALPDALSPSASVPRARAARALVIERSDASHDTTEPTRVVARAADVDRHLVARLGRGDIAVDARIDLHGLRAAVALDVLGKSLERARGPSARCALVVHGKGLNSGPAGPVLREMVIDQLSRPPWSDRVLAFTTAPRAHGGDGTLLVLLRARERR